MQKIKLFVAIKRLCWESKRMQKKLQQNFNGVLVINFADFCFETEI